MKVILYIDTTVNGMIGKEDGNSDFTSPEDAASFTAICQKAGVVVMGRKTYEVLYPNYLPLKEGLHIVLTKNKYMKSDNPTVSFRNQSPTDIINWLNGSGCETTVVIGGSETVSQFMKEGLINEMFVDIEPLIYGKGMPLFKPNDFEFKLKLLKTKMLSAQTIQLHYQVLK
jgi:dihydrofolate reductase